MNIRLQASIALAMLGVASLAVTPQAQACGLQLVKAANGQWTIASPPTTTSSIGRMMHLASTPATHTPVMRNPLQLLAPIAGLYEVTLTAEGNGPTGVSDGTQVDHGYVAWHADGTEIMNSGRPAGDSSFCLGTWARTGPRTYQLNHFMLSWAQFVSAAGDTNPPSPPLPTGALYYVNNEFVGPASIQETITLSPDGNSYTGTFVLTQYNTKYDIILPGGMPIKGVVTGTRKTIDSPVTY